MADTVTIDRDLLEWALDRVGDGPNGCAFEPVLSSDPDHHGKEFAAALFDTLITEVAEFEALKLVVGGKR